MPFNITVMRLVEASIEEDGEDVPEVLNSHGKGRLRRKLVSSTSAVTRCSGLIFVKAADRIFACNCPANLKETTRCLLETS